MLQYLFVYGTLMRRAAAAPLGRPERARLDAAGDWLGEARIAGCLYDLGRYPVLVAEPGAHEVVHGEVYRLHMPGVAFRWLDHYEGIPPGSTRGLEYERVIKPVHLAGGGTIEAWVYMHSGAVGQARRLADGRWRPRAEHR